MLLALVLATSLLCPTYSISIDSKSNNWSSLRELRGITSRAKRTNSRVIQDCMVVGLEEGTYFHKSLGTSDVCGIYLLAQPDQRVEITLEYLNVDCDTAGLVSIVDGWELGGELFPSEVDSPLTGRVHELCGKHKKKLIVTESNAAVIQYRLPRRGDVFTFTLKFKQNPTPCNILVDSENGVYTLHNYGRRSNCTVSSIFPASVNLLQLSIGTGPTHRFGRETGIIHRCIKRGSGDYLAVGGSSGLDSANMEVEDSLCGLSSNPLMESHILCGVTTVRLVSSGAGDNSATVIINQMTDPDVMPTLMCNLPL